MRYRLLLLYTTFLFSLQVASAQFYQTGQDPASLKWKQIKTGRFTVIYPEKYGREGVAYAKSLDEAYSNLVLLFPEKKFKIPVVIHNFTVQSNGYVAWAPSRMELYPTPEQNTIPLAPEKQLSIHELAHVFQMESLNQGFSKGMSFFFGEQFTGIVASLLPPWLLEGDAVFAESVLTQSGRGRTPSFQKQLKALMVETKQFCKYDKILNGSYRDFVPDNYQSGFQMVTWALAKKDPQVWNKALKFTAEQPLTLNPVNISLSRSLGLRKKTLWNETYDTLRTIWTKEVRKNNPEVYEVANPDKHGKYINYYSPVYAGTDSIIAIKTSLSLPSSFVLINPATKTEKRIHTPGHVYPWFISYGKGKLVWVETQSDPRWENREYSVIKVLDIKSRKVTKLSRKSRFLAASVSPDGSKIAAVENSIDNINKLVLIDSETGVVIQSVNSPGNFYLQHPQWAEGGMKVTFVFLSDAGEGILSFAFAGQQWETLIEASRDDLQSSFLRNDSLFFISSSSGTDNIYLHTPDNKTTALTRSGFGTIDLSPAGNKLFFGDYTFLGNNICSTSIEAAPEADKDNASSSFLINRFDIKPHADADSNEAKYVPVPYRKWQHLFRFHSWMPFYADIQELNVDPVSVRPGVTIMTQNALSTLTSTIGYEYSAEKLNVLHSRITWRGWYPVFESQFDYGNTAQIYKLDENVSNPSDIKPGINFINSVYLPLRFNSGSFSEYFRPSLSSDYRNQYFYIKEDDSYDYGQTIISARLYFSNYYRSAFRDIYPKWAQTIDFNYSFAPFDKNIYGSAVSLRSALFFPGFLPNNSIKIRIEKEKQLPVRDIFFGNRVSLPRGYNNIFPTDIDLLSADYVLPLAYPDFNIASLLYLKRIRTGLFYDYATGPGNSFYQFSANGLVPLYNNPDKISFRSFGFELLADFHLLRIPFMISGGIQSAWKNLNESPFVELLFNIDLYGMTFGRRQL